MSGCSVAHFGIFAYKIQDAGHIIGSATILHSGTYWRKLLYAGLFLNLTDESKKD